MIVFIRTKKEHTSFIVGATSGNHGHQVSIDVEGHPDYFPKKYDVGISFMSTYKIPKPELDKARWINFHPAPLPEYKGRNLCYHAIMNGETQFGASVHYMDENFDTGDIIDVLRFSIPEWANAEDVSGFAVSASKQLFQLYLPRILNGEVFPATRNVGGAYYEKTEIPDTLELRSDYGVGQFIRAVTYKEFYPSLIVGGVRYKIVRDE